jgi:TPR repeat protein
MAEFYANGEGVTKDEVQAATWYRKAAEQGDASGQNALGVYYFYGRGVAKDYKQAAFWYRKASDQGDAIAQSNLGEVYANGFGVAKDEIEAYAYYNLAAIDYEEARKEVDKLEKKLSREEIAAGQKRAKELHKEIEEKISAKKAETDKQTGK